jgi:hypothetical protein
VKGPVLEAKRHTVGNLTLVQGLVQLAACKGFSLNRPKHEESTDKAFHITHRQLFGGN